MPKCKVIFARALNPGLKNMFEEPPSGGSADNPIRNYAPWHMSCLLNKAVKGLLVVLFVKYNH